MSTKPKEDAAPKPVRWRERTHSDPQGGLGLPPVPMVRVVEGIDPPANAEIVTDEPHDWKEVG